MGRERGVDFSSFLLLLIVNFSRSQSPYGQCKLPRKIWHVSFWAGLIEVGFILSIQNNVKIRGSLRLFRHVPLGTKYNQFVV